jgi:hypothetical protein
MMTLEKQYGIRESRKRMAWPGKLKASSNALSNNFQLVVDA